MCRGPGGERKNERKERKKTRKKIQKERKRRSHLEDVSEAVLDLVHDFDKRRVEVSQKGKRLRREHARVRVGRAGAHEQAGRDLEEEEVSSFEFFFPRFGELEKLSVR